RNDGLPGLEETYDFTWPEDQQFVSEFGVIYTSTDEGNPCNFGEIFTTDGRIAALELKVIEDDENFFLSYLSSLTMPEEFYEANPEISEMFGRVGEPLTEEEMTAMNARVDVDGEFEEDVAREWLQEQGFIE
ncbi:MAG: glycine/betaine ABC transporter substrate-binding protein, partial [Actinomycetota bacterium]|nr:glycine/betaine ABC transporter substrate-binding protein [Actinomycetota bacterium]